MDKIKPCPFCGGEGMMENIRALPTEPELLYFIKCRCCASEGGWGKSEASAVRWWNQRVGEADDE